MSIGSSSLPGPPKPSAKSLNCPHCGAAITLRALGQAVSVVCESCHSVLDAKDPNLQILQTLGKIIDSDAPLIPLGTRGKIRGTDYEVIGFQRRNIKVEGISYCWREYVLFNPYKGFRYLTEYQGHWNDVSVCKEQPIAQGSCLEANYLGEVYKHFQTADASTDFVLGEFPWEVRVSEQATVTDFIHPPRVLSREKTSGEVSWSIGEYMYGSEVWSAFRLAGSPPNPQGVYENQPSPVRGNTQVWLAFAAFVIVLLALIAAVDLQAKKQSVFQGSYHSGRVDSIGEASFVTDPFELTGNTSNVQVTTSAAVQNEWIYLNYALINQDTGQAWDFGREVSYYYGRDSDGAWTEGSQKDSVIIPSVPPGHYYLRIEPETDPRHPVIPYTVQVKRDVPVFSFYAIGFVALLVPPVLLALRTLSFERARWSESDHPPAPIFKREDDD